MAVRYTYPFNADANICNFDLLNPRGKTGSLFLYNNLNTVHTSPLQIDLRTRPLSSEGFLRFYKNNFAFISGNPIGISNSDINFGLRNKTYSFWIKPDNIKDSQMIMSIGWRNVGFNIYISGGNICTSYYNLQSLGLEHINVTWDRVLPGIWQNITVASSEFTNVASPLIYINGVSARNYKTNRSGSSITQTFPASNAFGIRGVLHFGCNYYRENFMIDVGFPALSLMDGLCAIQPGLSGYMGLMGGNFYYFNKVLTRSEIIELVNKDKRRYENV